LACQYEKIHMYDVEIKNGPSTRESDTKKPGDRIVVCDPDFCKIGLSICYDMRFPELYRIQALMGAKVLFVPANYTMFTGKDHWECILKTRAIENQCYVVAPAQIGKKTAFQAYGRSMIINPWGVTIACAEDREQVIYAEIDPGYVDQIREQLPSLKNRQPRAYRWPTE
ncbi:MAG: carbon-nitrogen hydrolase family protein, partial [Pyramidobacter sp.]|nr:carbon-nitrogen hydrolase family protein [Pyramidobacter sp.]